MAIYFPFVLLLSDLATALVLGAGAAFESRGIVTAGVVIAFLLYLNQFFSPIQQLSQVLDTWQQATASVEKIAELLDTPEDVGRRAPPVPIGRLRGEVALRRRALRLRHDRGGRGPGRRRPRHRAGRDRRPGGRDRRRQVDARQAARPLLRPDRRARSLVDGLDLRDIDLDRASATSWASCPRRPSCSPGTVRDNIAYGRPDATDAEVEAAARAVGAHDFIALAARRATSRR